ncbi:MAG: hypothetical protein AB7P76_07620 [Candidatus Melainabacteria bacterium]
MSDTPESTATIDKPAAPAAEKTIPFSVDALQNCTARFTRQGWDRFLEMETDLEKIQSVPMRFAVEARSVEGAEELHKLYVESGVKEISRKDKLVSLTGTFADLQQHVKHPEVLMVDAIRI